MNPYHALAGASAPRSATASVGGAPEGSSSTSTYVALGVAAVGLLLYFKVAKNPAEARAAETAADYGG